jgi:hypothetical protein
MIGEKLIRKKIEGNKIIITKEFKHFSYDYNDIVQEINDYITDDPEELFNIYGICLGFDDFYSIDATVLKEALEEYIEDADEDDVDIEKYKGFIEKLKEADGFDIFLQMTKEEEYYEN